MNRPHATKESPFLVRTATSVLAAAAMAVCCSALAEDPQAARSLLAVQLSGASLANLEGAFWVCDYTATKRRASDDQIGMCTATYDALKERKFGGDFDALLLWWQKNRAAEFAKLEAMDHPRQ